MRNLETKLRIKKFMYFFVVVKNLLFCLLRKLEQFGDPWDGDSFSSFQKKGNFVSKISQVYVCCCFIGNSYLGTTLKLLELKSNSVLN